MEKILKHFNFLMNCSECVDFKNLLVLSFQQEKSSKIIAVLVYYKFNVWSSGIGVVYA